MNLQHFMSNHDLVWSNLPTSLKNAPILGNGLLGTYLFSKKDQLIEWEICRTDVVNNRQDEDTPLYAKRRLPIGRIKLSTVGKIIQSNSRLDLYQAESRTQIKTTRGEIELTTWIHAQELVIVIEMVTSGEERDAQFTFVPQETICPPRLWSKIKEVLPDPKPVSVQDEEVNLSLQTLLGGGGYATAWQELKQDQHHRRVYISVGKPAEVNKTIQEAKQHVLKAAKIELSRLKITHREWWDHFYRKSFVSLPDTRLESFYWIQMYKMGSATRSDRPAIDELGPWYSDSAFLMIWWNLNIQVTYWPFYAANHVDLAESYTKILSRNMDNLILNVPEEFRDECASIGRTSSYDCLNNDLVGKEYCNLPWACHNMWLHYRYSMDRDFLSMQLFPLLKKTMNFYIRNLIQGEDGRLHMPLSMSPEYSNECGNGMSEDNNVDLALIRWGIETLIQITELLQIEDDKMSVWQHTLERLVDYQIDETGLMVGRDVPYAESHRHFSHLFPIFPLYLMNWEQLENRELIEKSLNHWMSLPEAFEGYSYTTASCVTSMMGQGNRSLDYLNHYIDQYLEKNTMYCEYGDYGIGYAIETPFYAMRSIQDMLIQSWGEYISIFPAIPDHWGEVAMENMLTEGAFLVTAQRNKGELSFVRIESLAGGCCKFKAAFKQPVISDAKWTLEQRGHQQFAVEMLAGEVILIHEAGMFTDGKIQAVETQRDRRNYFGGDCGLPLSGRHSHVD